MANYSENNQCVAAALDIIAKDKTFSYLWQWGVVTLRVEHIEYEGGELLDSIVDTNIEEAKEFVLRDDKVFAEAFIDGLECINVLDLSNVLTED